MEDRAFLPISSVPSFAQGLKILLVHNVTLSLMNLSSMLEKYSFRETVLKCICEQHITVIGFDYSVTVTDEVKAAMSMICDAEEGQFNLVMAKDNMPDMDILSFLHFMLEKYIPVIFMTSGEYNDVTWKALAKGSCFFLEEPILLEDLKYVWQHVYHTRVNSAKKTNKENFANKVHGTLADHRKCLQGKEKRQRLKMNFDSNHLTAFMDEEDEDTEREQKFDDYAEKRPRIVWTQELHQKFLDAINVLSERNNIRPKAILEQMNVSNLTARQISSHLQKYRTQELINQQACISGFTPMAAFSNFDGRSQSSSGPGFPTSITALSGSQNQNQYINEFPTAAMSNYGSQNLKAEVEQQPIADASMDQINYQAMRSAHYDTMKMLEEDSEELDYSQKGLLPHQIDQYCEMLRNTLLSTNSPHPQEPDM